MPETWRRFHFYCTYEEWALIPSMSPFETCGQIYFYSQQERAISSCFCPKWRDNAFFSPQERVNYDPKLCSVRTWAYKTRGAIQWARAYSMRRCGSSDARAGFFAGGGGPQASDATQNTTRERIIYSHASCLSSLSSPNKLQSLRVLLTNNDFMASNFPLLSLPPRGGGGGRGRYSV